MPKVCLQNPQVGGCGFPGAACGPTCTTQPECTSDANCPSGYVCPPEPNGVYYAAPGKRICERPTCADDAEEVGCGGPWDECGVCRCTPHCENKHCGDSDLSNGCGGRCVALCGDGATGCQLDADCHAGSSCIGNVCRPTDPCARPDIAPPDCGAGTVCGECPAVAVASCVDRECGTDPVTGASCGPNCPIGHLCGASGHCARIDDTTGVVVPPDRPVEPPPAPPAISIGALPGAFSVSEQGSATYVIPIDVPPGRAGIEPALTLRYSSSTGNGALGVGFSIDGLSTISRCPRFFGLDGYTAPVLGTDADAVCLDGQRLVVVNNRGYWEAGAEYRTSVDTFNKVVLERRGPNAGLSFTVYKKDGRIFRYGENTSSRSLMAPTVVGTWALSRVEDRSTNFMSIAYRQRYQLLTSTGGLSNGFQSTAELLPSVITYTGHGQLEGDRELVFNYVGDREDVLFGFQPSGGAMWRTQRLDHIDVRAQGRLVRSYALTYVSMAAENPLARLSLVRTVTECTPSACKPATVFDYHSGQVGFEAPQVVHAHDGFLHFDGGFDNQGLVRYGVVYGAEAGFGGPVNHLRTLSFNSYTTDVTPYFGLAAFAVSFVPEVGPFASMALNIAGEELSSSSSDYSSNDIDFATRQVEGPTKNCGGDPPSWQIVARDPFGDVLEDLHATCPITEPTGKKVVVASANSPTVQMDQKVTWTPPVWLVDIDGDGVQDKLYCSANKTQVLYKLARTQANREIPLSATTAQADGQAEAFGGMCGASCGREIPMRCRPECLACPGLTCPSECGDARPDQSCQEYAWCAGTRQFSTAFDANGDGTSDLIVYDRTQGWAAYTFNGTLQRRTDWFAG
ncbi:MAG TPA: SpvB/TcaC N-terminal domain-containing protein, partial [Actinomycetes bacterium]|nr:SpvB/TcaC N-terminal domain-containing protein [Actinomycetes bacterium]